MTFINGGDESILGNEGVIGNEGVTSADNRGLSGEFETPDPIKKDNKSSENDENTLITSITAQVKADMLIEALPYIKKWSKKIVVVKYGGNAISGFGDKSESEGDEKNTLSNEINALKSFAKDIVILSAVGMKPVVVHGGGPQIGELLRRVGKVSEFRDGQRVTDAETLEIARMVLVGKVNRDIVNALNFEGQKSVGLSGEDGGLISAEQRHVDLGYVGDVVGVDPSLIHSLLEEDIIPVVATIGSSVKGQAYNINADAVASALAVALKAEKLVYLSDVDGVRERFQDSKSLISSLSIESARNLIESGAIAGGMVPKVEACISSVEGGVGSAHILDGTVPHALLIEIFTDGGVGTMVTL